MGKSKCNSNDRMKEEEERFIEMLKVFNSLSHTHIYIEHPNFKLAVWLLAIGPTQNKMNFKSGEI
jgi:hypothetical protein